MNRKRTTAALVVGQFLLRHRPDWQAQTPEQLLSYLRQELSSELDLWTVERAIRHLQEGDL